MALLFKKASERTQTQRKSHGVIAQIIGMNGSIEHMNPEKALIDQACSLKCTLVQDNGDVLESVFCSKKVMADIWSRDLSINGLKFLDLIESLGDKTALNPETGLYEKVVDEEGNTVKEPIFIIDYAGVNSSELSVKVTQEDLLKAESAKRNINWEELITV